MKDSDFGVRAFGIAREKTVAVFCTRLVILSASGRLLHTPLPVWEQVAQALVPSQRDLCKRHSSHARDTRFLVEVAGAPVTGSTLVAECSKDVSISTGKSVSFRVNQRLIAGTGSSY